MATSRTSGTKVALFHIETGQRIERWPVDAREILQRGGYALTPPNEPPVEDVEAALRVAMPPAAAPTDAALISDTASPTGAPLQVVREGVMTTAGTAVEPSMSKRVR